MNKQHTWYQGSSRRMRADASTGVMYVEFDDSWSAGDKGRSRQPIPGMGRARHRAAMTSFRLAACAGLPTHFLSEFGEGFRVMELSVPSHPPLSGDETHGKVLPAEFIWRRKVAGSLHQRLKKGAIDPVTLGFDRGYEPKEGELLPRVMFECTTKYEPLDRKLSDEEARDLTGLSMEEWLEAWSLIEAVVAVTTRAAEKAGFDVPDGKIELGQLWADGKLIVADTFGTQDENRIIRLSDGAVCSKDLIRNHLKKVGYSAELQEAQAAFPDDSDRWPDYPQLPDWLVQQVAELYTDFADRYKQAARVCTLVQS